MTHFNYQTNRHDIISLYKTKENPNIIMKSDSNNGFSRNYSSHITNLKTNTLLSNHKTEHKRYLSYFSNQNQTLLKDQQRLHHSRNQNNAPTNRSSLLILLNNKHKNKLPIMKHNSHNDFINSSKSINVIKSSLIKPSLKEKICSGIKGFASMKLMSKDKWSMKTNQCFRKNIDHHFRSIDISSKNQRNNNYNNREDYNDPIIKTIDMGNEDLNINKIDEKVAESFEENLLSSSKNDNISESSIKHDDKDFIKDNLDNYIFDRMSPRSIKELKELNEYFEVKNNNNAKSNYNNFFNEHKAQENIKTGLVTPGFKIYPTNVIKYNFDSKFKFVIQTLKKKNK